MNISANISAAVIASGIKGGYRAPGKTAASSSGSADPVERVEFSDRATQETGDASFAANIISNSTHAEAETGYLKNVILALPALVLGSQANLMRESGLKLL
ncbi:MAG: hypothetical protein PHQ12_02200 [Chthoniobacteraceae bacterium]|nr:hypothetical protein [Chthoniobacteraceae bacterium]